MVASAMLAAITGGGKKIALTRLLYLASIHLRA
jgi:hypothetical protein